MTMFYLFVLVFSLGVAAPNAMKIADFFPDINGNLTEITWAHAVNNKTYLADALNSSVMMLEADVIYGQLNGSGESIPIMGHPPANTSDLSLGDFLQATYDFNKNATPSARKGVKLDFKSIEVFLKSIDLVTALYGTIDYPLWINADIIPGPLEPTTVPVDPDQFLAGARSFNNSLTVLSLGWTTSLTSPNIHYTDAQIDAMVDAIQRNQVTQDITFAVRAGTTSRSKEQIDVLKDKVNNCTLTVWGSEGDYVDIVSLRDVIFDYGVDRVYVDVPADLRSKLDLGNVTAV